jgi:predicted outer membrane repeat protein
MISAENEGMCDTFLDTAFFDSNNASYGGAIHYSSMVPCTGVIPPPGTSIPETGIFGFRYDLVLLKDTSFLNNQAVISGGAVYFAGITNAYFEYEGLTLQDNKAAVSGSHFFFNPLPVNDAIEHSAPNFCNSSRCHITSTTSTVLDHRKGAGVVGIQPLSSKPQWGSLWASSGLWPTVSILSGSDFDVIVPFNPKVDNGSLTAFPGDWRVVIAFRDLYDQLCSQSIWLDPDLTFRGNDSGFDCGEAICPWNVSSSRGYGFLSLGITLRHSFLQAYPPDVFDPKIANPYEHPLQIKGSLRFKSLPSADPSALSEASVELNLIIKGCPVGFGLTPSPGDPIMMSCQPCPLNTYNLDGNGQCYACGRGDSEYAICEGSLIQSQPGYWATNVNKTNQLFVSECPLGFCVSPSCAHGRTGAMCSECVDGMFESLFPFCSAHLCSKPNVSFLLLLGIVAAILFPLMVHIAIFRWPDETRHVLNIAFLTLLILQPLFDWAIPLSARRLAEFICGFRATPLQRLYFLALVPYASFVGLWATFAVERLIATLASLFSTSSTWTIAGLHQTGSIFDIKRFALTSGAILYLVGVQPLKFALDLSLCSITPFGQVWLIHPSVNCESKSFRISETVMWILVALLTLVPHLATLGFWIFTTIKRRAASKQTEYQFFLLIPSKGTIENYGSHTRLESTKDGLVVSNADLLLEAEFESIEPIQQAFFFIARGKSLLWPFVEMATRVAIPFICSLTLFHPNIRSALLASVFLIAMGFNSVASPFESLLPRLTASGSWAVLALLSIWLVELQSDPRFTLAVFSLSPVFIVTLVILFAWANRTAKKSEPSGSSNSPSSFMSPTQRMDQVETTHTLTEEEAPASACSSLVQEQDPDRSQSL